MIFIYMKELIKQILKEETEKIEENLVNSDIFRIIAESEKPKLNKSDILNYIKSKKNS